MAIAPKTEPNPFFKMPPMMLPQGFDRDTREANCSPTRFCFLAP